MTNEEIQKAKKNLEVFIAAAKMRREALDHVLLYGPPGKSSISTIRCSSTFTSKSKSKRTWIAAGQFAPQFPMAGKCSANTAKALLTTRKSGCYRRW